MNAEDYVPRGFDAVNFYMVETDAARLIEFLKAVFAAEELTRIPSPDGGVAHAELSIGDSMLETSDAHGPWTAMPSSLHVYVPDIDAAYQRALAAGAESLAEPKDQFYGERSASVRDPVGNVWHIATTTEELTVEEMEQRAAKVHSHPDRG